MQRLIPDADDQPLQTYTLDASCFEWLDGNNLEPDDTPRYTIRERDRVWAALDDLMAVGRLKIIAYVRQELQKRGRHDILTRLARFKSAAPPMNNDVRLAYQSITDQFRGVVRYEWDRDPADPWIVAYAEVYGYVVVTDELPSYQHTIRSKRKKTFIPDMCDGRNPMILWTSLRELAISEGWIAES